MLEVVRRIDVGTMLHKQAHDFVVPGAGRHEQRGFTHSVAGVDCRAGPEQRLHKEAIARLCRPM